MFDLTGKIALITGATGGIGQAIAKQMKDRGAKLILSGTRENVLNQMVKDLGDDVKSVVSNLQDKDSILSMAKDAEACHGKIDILVNNAGITIDGLSLIHI